MIYRPDETNNVLHRKIIAALRKAGAGEVVLQFTKHFTLERLASKGLSVDHALQALRSGEVVDIKNASFPGEWKAGVSFFLADMGTELRFAFLVGADDNVTLLTTGWAGGNPLPISPQLTQEPQVIVQPSAHETDLIINVLRRAGAGEIELQLSKHIMPERLAQMGLTSDYAPEALRTGEVVAIEKASFPGEWKAVVQLPIGERQIRFGFLVKPDGCVALITAIWMG